MVRRRAAKCIGLALFLLAGCSRNSSSSSGASTPAVTVENGASQSPASAVSQSDRDAITAAIQKHLADDKTINMAAMDMSVDSIAINGDQAHADASFRLKQGGTGMMMTYFLERHANGWLVMRSQPADGQFVHPPMDKIHSGAASSPSASPDSSMPDVSDIFKNRTPQKSN